MSVGNVEKVFMVEVRRSKS